MLLLDTHALLWWLADDPALSPAARTAIAAGQTQVFVSAASAWEMSIKRLSGNKAFIREEVMSYTGQG